MTDFLNEVQLLYSSRTVLCKELKFKQYRNLLKCFLGDEIDTKLILLNSDYIIKSCTNLTDHEIQNLSYIDYLLLLFQIRIISLGNGISLVAEVDSKQIKLDLSLDKVVSHIQNLLTPEFFYYKKINSFNFKIPTINEILKIENSNSDGTIFFIDKIKIDNIDIPLKSYTDTEKEKILQNLPLKNIITINKSIEKIINQINSTNFLNPLYSDTFQQTLPLIPNLNNIAFLIKLVFNNSIQYVYETIFVLSKYANITGEFLDTCTPGEFFYFAKKFEEINAQTSKKQQVNTSSDLPPVNEDESMFKME